jgi:hypothetical protein
LGKPSLKRLNYLIKDEKKAAKQYRKDGFPQLAKDESRHARFLTKEKNKRTNRKYT